MRRCLSCKKQITGHFNRKRCEPCVSLLRKRPQSTLTKEQILEARKLIGKMDRNDIAERLGVSLSNLKRAFRGTRLAYYNYCTVNPKLVRDVNKYYEKHGLNRTFKKFNLKKKQVEHIIYRYKQHSPRQIRWTNNEIIEAARMAGIVSPAAQARFFKRPNANAGSIKSLWMKRFKMGQGCVNGMTHWCAKELVNKNARYLKPIGESRKGEPTEFRRLILWIDMEKNLKRGVPPFMRSAVKTMADFQRWIHGGGDVKAKIIKLMKEREGRAYVR